MKNIDCRNSAIFFFVIASISSFSLTMLPRAFVLMKKAVSFIMANSSLPILPFVVAVAGKLTLTKSASLKTSARDTTFNILRHLYPALEKVNMLLPACLILEQPFWQSRGQFCRSRADRVFCLPTPSPLAFGL